ncbi:amino acid adenylation domain-containing protein [Streptomyces albidoflavus]|uniref:amino acid adenylation domain-containing protein n=1 Tax=Streptomyces albidoflavus TaxID=1886 RepID=UPI0033BFE53F
MNRLPQLLQDIVDNIASRPDQLALAGADGELTYRRLGEESARIAGALIEAGVRPGQRVGVVGHKTTAAVVSLLAVMRAGAAYVPLDPRAPVARLVDLVNDAECPVVLTSATRDRQLADTLESSSCAKALNARTLTVEGEPSLPNVGEESAVALCFYTSGSTGRPKGVQLSYEAISAFHAGFNELAAMDARSRCLNMAALHFDVSLYDVWLPLRVGAVVHVGPAIPVPDVVLGLIGEQQITHTHAVGSTMKLLAEESANFRGYDLTSLRVILSGAEIINPQAVQRWLEAAPNLAVINGYGPAEATATAINHVITEREPDRTEFYPIGVPPRGTEIRFRDEDGRIDMDGPGEILIAGPQLMVGYLKRPEEEARAFLVDGGIRYYRTGDWGSRRPDGVCLFIGRRDDEIKVRGYRVNLNEINRQLEAHTEITRSFSGTAKDHNGAQLLVSAIASTELSSRLASHSDDVCLARLPGHEERTLRGYLSECLPSYMLPDAMYSLPWLPVLSSGKPDKSLVGAWLRRAVEESS